MRKTLVLIAFLLIVAVAGAWIYLPELTARAIRYEAAIRGIDVTRLEIRRVGWKRLEITALAMSSPPDLGRVTVEIDDLAVDYGLWSRRLHRVQAARASITGSLHPVTATVGRSPLPLPVLPPMDVETLQLELATPVGAIHFNGQVGSRIDGRSADVYLTDDLGTVSLRYDQLQSTLSAEIAAAQSPDPILGAELRLDQGDPVAYDLRLDLPAWLHWLEGTPLVPPAYRVDIGSVRLHGGELRATGAAAPDGNWRSDVQMRWQDLRWQQYSSSGELAGQITRDGRAWRWHTEKPGNLRVILTDAAKARASEVVAVELGLRPGYVVTGTWPDLAGTGGGTLSAIRKDGVVLRGGSPDWRLDDSAGALSLSLQGLRVEPIDIRADRLQTTARRQDDSFQNWSGGLAVSNLRLPDWPSGQRGVGLSGEWRSTSDTLNGRGSMDIPDAAMTRWEIDSRGEDGSLRVNLSAPAPLLLQWGRPLIGVPEIKLAVGTGIINADGNMEWKGEQYRGSINVSGENINGTLVKSEFSGMKIEATSGALPPLAGDLKVTAKQGQLAVGTPWHELKFTGRWSLQGVEVDQAAVDILGGTLSILPFKLSWGGSQALRMVVNLSGIDLSQLLQFLGLEALSGEGTFDGSLPIVLSPQGPAVEHGVLVSTGPGKIRFRSAGEETLAGMGNLALRALQDFRYKSLNATLSYHTNGDYNIRLRLLGNNPQVLNGYPLALNPNVTGNLPDLLQAVLLTGDFGTAVLQQIQRQQDAVAP